MAHAQVGRQLNNACTEFNDLNRSKEIVIALEQIRISIAQRFDAAFQHRQARHRQINHRLPQRQLGYSFRRSGTKLCTAFKPVNQRTGVQKQHHRSPHPSCKPTRRERIAAASSPSSIDSGFSSMPSPVVRGGWLLRWACCSNWSYSAGRSSTALGRLRFIKCTGPRAKAASNTAKPLRLISATVTMFIYHSFFDTDNGANTNQIALI